MPLSLSASSPRGSQNTTGLAFYISMSSVSLSDPTAPWICLGCVELAVYPTLW